MIFLCYVFWKYFEGKTNQKTANDNSHNVLLLLEPPKRVSSKDFHYFRLQHNVFFNDFIKQLLYP